MLPNVEISSAANASGLSPGQKTESTKAVQPQEVQTAVKNVQETVPDTVRKSGEDRRTDIISLKSQPNRETPATQKAAPTGRSTTRKYEKTGTTDQAEINFQVTREEREALVNYVSGKEDVKEMTEEEQDTLQKVTERIQKMIENAQAKDTERGERLDKAVKEWYNRLSNGKDKAPANLIKLINLAAMGVPDLSKID